MTLGRSLMASHSSSASISDPRSCPPRSVTTSRRVGSSYFSISDTSSAGAPSVKRARRSGPWSAKSDWYFSLGMPSIQSRRRCPPGALNSSVSRSPYLTSLTCQPDASNWARHCLIRMPGTTRSSDCRLKSTIQSTLPRPSVAGSAIASHTLPSSSSASPRIDTKRD